MYGDGSQFYFRLSEVSLDHIVTLSNLKITIYLKNHKLRYHFEIFRSYTLYLIEYILLSKTYLECSRDLVIT